MIENYVRPLYQQVLVDPLAKVLTQYYQITANYITAAAAVAGVLAALFLGFNCPIIACCFLLLSGYLDTLDGTFARFTRSTSDLGTVLDIIADRFVEFLIILALYSIDPTHRATVALFMLGSILLCVTSFLIVGLFSDNNSEKSFHYSPGIMERPEAFVFFIAMILLPHWFVALGSLFVVLVCATTGMRVWEFYKKH